MKLPPSRILSLKGTTLAGSHAGFLVRTPEPSLPELKYVSEEWAFPEYVVRPHSHADYELHLQLSGASEWIVNGASFSVPADSLIIVAPGEKHVMRSQSAHSQHFIYAGIDLAGALERYQLPGELLEGRSCFFIPDAKPFLAPFSSLSHEVTQSRPHRRELLELAFRSILYLFLREDEKAGEHSEYESTIDDNLTFRIKRYLHTHISNKVSVDEMAKVLNVSRSLIFLTAKRELGMTPLLYHTRLRMELAKEMLKMPMMPLTTIAIDLGYSSSQHFSTVFRKMEGVSPSDYRRNLAVADS